jgi:hypothetical protein
VTDISAITHSAKDVELLIRREKNDGKRLDILAEALGREKNAQGLRVVLDVGLLDPQQVTNIGDTRYRAIFPILSTCPDEHEALVSDWMAQTYQANPHLATVMLCEIINKATTEFQPAAKAYRICQAIGMDMHRQVDVFLTKMGEIASTVERFELSHHTPFAALMCRFPAGAIDVLIKRGVLQTLSDVPPAGEAMTSNGNGRQLNLLEYFGCFHANNLRTDLLMSLLDKESAQVKLGLADSIVMLVKEFGMRDNKSGPTDTALKMAMMINAGADLERLADGMGAIGLKKEGERRNILHILASADYVKLGTTSTSRYEPVVSAIERLTTTIDPELAKTFEFDVNADNGIGKTPLHFAIKSASTDVIELLLHAGANYAARTHDDVTPEATAIALGRNDVAALLQSWGARQAIEATIKRAQQAP